MRSDYMQTRWRGPARESTSPWIHPRKPWLRKKQFRLARGSANRSACLSLRGTRVQIAGERRGGNADRQGARLDPLDFYRRRPHQTYGEARKNGQHDGVRNVLEQNGHRIDDQAVVESQSGVP